MRLKQLRECIVTTSKLSIRDIFNTVTSATSRCFLPNVFTHDLVSARKYFLCKFTSSTRDDEKTILPHSCHHQKVAIKSINSSQSCSLWSCSCLKTSRTFCICIRVSLLFSFPLKKPFPYNLRREIFKQNDD